METTSHCVRSIKGSQQTIAIVSGQCSFPSSWHSCPAVWHFSLVIKLYRKAQDQCWRAEPVVFFIHLGSKGVRGRNAKSKIPRFKFSLLEDDWMHTLVICLDWINGEWGCSAFSVIATLHVERKTCRFIGKVMLPVRVLTLLILSYQLYD